jgi:hypothetical protein
MALLAWKSRWQGLTSSSRIIAPQPGSLTTTVHLTVAPTLDDLTPALALHEVTHLSLAQALDDLTASFGAHAPVHATLACTLDALTPALGLHTVTHLTLAVLLEDLSVTATADLRAHVTLAVPLEDVTPDAVLHVVAPAALGLTLGDLSADVAGHVPLLWGTSRWYAAAAHDTTLAALAAQEAGTLTGAESDGYEPIIVADFVDLGRLFSTGPVIDLDQAEWEIAQLDQGGLGPITRDLAETDDQARLGNSSLVLRNEEQLSQTFATGVIDNAVVHISLGFRGLAFQDYLPLFWGIVDRHQIGYAMQLALTDNSVKENVSLNVPVSQYFPGAPPPSRTRNIPLVLGVLTDVPTLPVVQGPAGGTLGQDLGSSDTTLYLLEYGALFPDSGSLAVGSTAATATIGSGANGTVTVTARVPGEGGNALTIEVKATTAHSAPLQATQSGSALTVTLATTSSGSLDASQNTARLVAAALSALSSVSATASGTGATALASAEGPHVFAGGTDELLTYASRALVTLNGTTVLALQGLVRAAATTHSKGDPVRRTALDVTEQLIGLGTITVNQVKYGGTPLPADQYTVLVDTTHERPVTLLRLPFAPDAALPLTVDVNAPNIDTTDRITNGGFETGDTTGYSVSAATLLVRTSSPAPFAGQYYGALTGGLLSDGLAYQDLSLVAGEQYDYTLTYRNVLAPSLVTDWSFEAGLTGWLTRDISDAELVTDDAFTPPAEGTHTATARPVDHGVPLGVVNGDFETGTLTGWQLFGGAYGVGNVQVTTSSPYAGTYACTLALPTLYGPDHLLISTGIEQVVSVPRLSTPQTLTLRFAYRTSPGAAADNGTLTVQVGYKLVTATLYTTVVVEQLALSTSWTVVEIPCALPANVGSVLLDLSTTLQDAAHPVWVDSIALTTPAPPLTYSLTLYQDVPVVSGAPYTFHFRYLTGRDVVRGLAVQVVRTSTLTYALGTPADETAYQPETSVGQSHTYTDGSPTATTPGSMASLEPVVITPTSTTLRLRFTFSGTVSASSGGLPPLSVDRQFLAPFLASLDAVYLAVGAVPNQSSASLQIGVPGSAPALTIPLAVAVVWTTVSGTFRAPADVTRWAIASQYSVDSWPTYLDAWHVTAAFSFAAHSGGQNPVDTLLYLLDTFLPDTQVERTSFARARSLLTGWKFGGLLTSPGDSEPLVQRLAQQCKSVLVRDPLGRYTLNVLDNSRPILAAFDPTNMPGEFVQESGPIDIVYSEIYLYFGTRTGGSTSPADFAGVVFATPSATSGTGAQGDRWIARCGQALRTYGRSHRLDYFAEFIQDLTTANLFLDWLISRHTTRDDLVTFPTWLDALPLQLSHVITAEHPWLPNHGAPVLAEVVGHHFNASTMQLELTARVLGPAPLPAPVARDITLTTWKNHAITVSLADYVTPHAGAQLDVTTADIDPTLAGQQTVYLVPGVGTFSVDGTGTLTLTPVLHITGEAVTQYTLSDSFGTPSNLATITVDIVSEAAPVAHDVSIVTARNQPVTVSLVGAVLPATGFSVDWTTLDIDPGTPGTQTTYTLPGLGTLTADGAGNVTFTPDADVLGQGSTGYSVEDNNETRSNVATLEVTVVAFLVEAVTSQNPYERSTATTGATAALATPAVTTATSQQQAGLTVPLNPTATTP